MQQKNTIRANYNIIIQHHINAFYVLYCTVVGWSDFFSFKMDTRHVTQNVLNPLFENLSF